VDRPRALQADVRLPLAARRAARPPRLRQRLVRRAAHALEGIYAAVTAPYASTAAHPGGWVPQERITVDAGAARVHAAGARASFDEADRGTLERGKLADFVLIDRDLTRVPAETIRDARVVLTVVGGRVVFERGPAQ
jgi:predicted amidohydrolase YtcJ